MALKVLFYSIQVFEIDFFVWDTCLYVQEPCLKK